MNSAARKRSSRSVISSSPNTGGPSGSSAATSACSAVERAVLLGADRHDRGERIQRRELGHLRQQRVLVRELVDLVERHDHARPRAAAARRPRGPPSVVRPASTTSTTASTSARLCAHRAVHPLVEPRAVPRLETGRVDEDELRVARGQDAGDAVTRRLRLARGDADLLADQVVEQRRLADVGPADDGDVAAAERRRCRRLVTPLLRRRCSPRVSAAAGRRLLGRAPARPAAARSRRPARESGTRPRRSAHAPRR